MSSGSRMLAISVEPARSQNMTVSRRRVLGRARAAARARVARTAGSSGSSAAADSAIARADGQSPRSQAALAASRSERTASRRWSKPDNVDSKTTAGHGSRFSQRSRPASLSSRQNNHAPLREPYRPVAIQAKTDLSCAPFGRSFSRRAPAAYRFGTGLQGAIQPLAPNDRAPSHRRTLPIIAHELERELRVPSTSTSFARGPGTSARAEVVRS